MVLANLQKSGIVLPTPASAVANYVGYQIMGKILVVSGQLPLMDGKLQYEGTLTTTNTGDVDFGYQAARLCAINILAQVNQAIGGDWSKIKQCVRLGGFVACAADFKDHPRVINGASDLMVEILGGAGRHARAAVGVSSLPLGANVEVEALFELI
ncbi:MAG: RidA family protein [Alphaproteobacteria bacterium]|nr:RidA family protein [Alphaproteobacteria bacterium]